MKIAHSINLYLFNNVQSFEGLLQKLNISKRLMTKLDCNKLAKLWRLGRQQQINNLASTVTSPWTPTRTWSLGKHGWGHQESVTGNQRYKFFQDTVYRCFTENIFDASVGEGSNYDLQSTKSIWNYIEDLSADFKKLLISFCTVHALKLLSWHEFFENMLMVMLTMGGV